MTKATMYKKDDAIEFVGYSEEIPKEEQLLTVGKKYYVHSVDAKLEQVSILILDVNNEEIEQCVYFDEIKPYVEKEEKKVSTKKRGRPAAVKEEVKELVEETKAEEVIIPAEQPVIQAEPKKKRAVKDVTVLPEIVEDSSQEKFTEAVTALVEAGNSNSKDPWYEQLEILTKEDPEILALVNGTDDLLALAQELDIETINTEYKLAGVLYHVKLKGSYKQLDARYAEKGGWALYLSENLRLGARKANYLITAYIAGNKYLAEPSQAMSELGWTKMSQLATVMTEENAQTLVEKAKDLTVKELIEDIKKNAPPSEVLSLETFSFKLYKDQATVVKAALESAALALGLTNLSQVFEAIVVQWALEHPIAGKNVHERPGIRVPKQLDS